jgi:hypothetical protein
MSLLVLRGDSDLGRHRSRERLDHRQLTAAQELGHHGRLGLRTFALVLRRAKQVWLPRWWFGLRLGQRCGGCHGLRSAGSTMPSKLTDDQAIKKAAPDGAASVRWGFSAL